MLKESGRVICPICNYDIISNSGKIQWNREKDTYICFGCGSNYNCNDVENQRIENESVMFRRPPTLKHISIKPKEFKSQRQIMKIAEILDFIDNADIGEEFDIKIEEYTDEELKALPDFEGW